MNKASPAVRWTLVPVAALTGFFASFIIAIPLNGFIHSLLWSSGNQMPGKLFLMYVLPFDGALAASLFILLGAWAAPQHRSIVALALFIIGCGAAWLCVGEFYSPVGSLNGPVRVWWPIIGSYSGGLLTYLLVLILSRPKQAA